MIHGMKFAEMAEKLKGKKGVKDSKALAAKIEREHVGKEKFQQMAERGKRKAG